MSVGHRLVSVCRTSSDAVPDTRPIFAEILMTKPNRPARLALLITFMLCAPSCLGQPRLYRDRLTLNENQDGTFWYAVQTGPNQQQFVHVDPTNKTRRPAFDHQQVAAALTEKTGNPVQADALPVHTLRYEDDGHILLLGNANSWKLDPRTGDISPTENLPGHWLIAPPQQISGRGPSTSFTLTNKLDVKVRLQWMSADGQLVDYARLTANESIDIDTYAEHPWLLSSDKGRIGAFYARSQDLEFELTQEAVDAFRARQERVPNRKRARRNLLQNSDAQTSPNRNLKVEVRAHNLWLVNTDSQTAKQVTQGASAAETWQRDASRARLVNMAYNQIDYPADLPLVYWSPNSQYFVAIRSTRVKERRVTYIESLPKGSTTPRVLSYPYAKPGDALPIYTAHLFRSDGTEIPLPTELMSSPFELEVKGWSPDGQHCYLLYNERGHQTLRYLEIDADEGTIRPLIEESSETFIQYSSGKMVLRHLAADCILWASERSGWNHLYRYSTQDDRVIPVTQGEWNVRRIASIDRDNSVIWFYAVGVQQGQDPYHEHYCRVNLDGTNFQILTDGDGTHTVEHLPGGQWLLDRYSRVDLPPVHELRRADRGERVVSLESADAQEIEASMGHLPIRFHAPGRDGRTEIWGLIHLPKDFDKDQRYPVVENIYAGPHDHHVPKAFRTRYFHQREIADRGVVVVQIDGMGTAWRSKAFHDVCYKNLRDAGFPDRIAWMKAAAKKYPFLDLDRVGIYGGSAGGQNAMAALLWHNDFYSVAVADCGCHDNRVDKLWWNEQWMGWPVDQSYINSSNVENAHLLKGHLLLVVGELDRNVDPASTTQVVTRLIDAGKDFDFLLMTGAGHGSCERPYGRKRRADFLLKHLGVTAVEN